MMKLYFLATDTGCAEFLFADNEDRAVEVFSIYAVLSRIRLARFWFREIVPDALPPQSREDLLGALSENIEGFGHLENGTGWVIHPVEAKFDRVAADASERGSA
jgi:hypothetical protein